MFGLFRFIVFAEIQRHSLVEMLTSGRRSLFLHTWDISMGILRLVYRDSYTLLIHHIGNATL